MLQDKADPNIKREKQMNPIRNVAVVGLFDHEGKVLLVRTKRLPNHWQPIGGGVKYGETPQHTLKRELQEEAGVDIDLDMFKLELTTDYDFGEGTVYFFTAKMPIKESLIFDINQLEEWGWFSLEEATQLNVFPATKKFLFFLRER